MQMIAAWWVVPFRGSTLYTPAYHVVSIKAPSWIYPFWSINSGVGQSGSPSDSLSEGRRFESCPRNQKSKEFLIIKMKKLLVLFLCVVSLFSFTSCSAGMKEYKAADGISFIRVAQEHNDFEVFVHKETRVMYVVYSRSQTSNGMTVMLDRNGNPLLWNGVLPN